MKIQKSYVTSLELGNGEVSTILDAKLIATSPSSVVDYVAFSIDNIDNSINQAKQAKKELDDFIKAKESLKEKITIETAEWLANAGVDKLEGMRVSSITTYRPASKEKLVIHDERYFTKLGFIKTTLDETAIKNLLRESNDSLSEYAELEVTYQEEKIKINKKRN